MHIYWKHGQNFHPYSIAEIDSNFYAYYSYMIGLLAKIIRTSNLFIKFPRYLVRFYVSKKYWRALDVDNISAD